MSDFKVGDVVRVYGVCFAAGTGRREALDNGVKGRIGTVFSIEPQDDGGELVVQFSPDEPGLFPMPGIAHPMQCRKANPKEAGHFPEEKA